MGKSTVYRCDRPGCQRFEMGNTMPDNWITYETVAVVPVPADGAFGQHEKSPRHEKVCFELCSNVCVVKLAKERMEIAGESPSSSAQRAGYRRYRHRQGMHDNKPSKLCPFCTGAETDKREAS